MREGVPSVRAGMPKYGCHGLKSRSNQQHRENHMNQGRKHITASAAAVIALTASLLHTVVQAQAAKPSHGAGHSTSSSAASNHAGGMDMKAMMKENNDKMVAMSMTGKPDVDFAMMMRMHHQGAIQMAEVELKNGKDAEMKKMAQNIISDQKKEIAQLDKYLAKQGHSMDQMKK
jgi:uncharacterized protein (DUF305 family)